MQWETVGLFAAWGINLEPGEDRAEMYPGLNVLTVCHHLGYVAVWCEKGRHCTKRFIIVLWLAAPLGAPVQCSQSTVKSIYSHVWDTGWNGVQYLLMHQRTKKKNESFKGAILEKIHFLLYCYIHMNTFVCWRFLVRFDSSYSISSSLSF